MREVAAQVCRRATNSEHLNYVEQKNTPEAMSVVGTCFCDLSMRQAREPLAVRTMRWWLHNEGNE
jgi:hypothetical protein